MIAAVLAYFCRNDCSTKSIARCSWPISPHARASKRFRADTDPSTHRPARFVFLKRRREIHHPFSCVFFFFSLPNAASWSVHADHRREWMEDLVARRRQGPSAWRSPRSSTASSSWRDPSTFGCLRTSSAMSEPWVRAFVSFVCHESLTFG